MGNNKSITNVLRVMFSNITTIISSVLVGFLLPKVISLADYGYYKTFTLYITYLGLCSLGIVDGIALKHGSDDYETLDKPRFRSYFQWFSIIIAVFSFVIILISFVLDNRDTRFIFIMVGLSTFSGNITNYFRYISQITQRFNEYSKRVVLQSVAKMIITVAIAVLFYLGITPGYRLYLFLVVIFDVILTIWYIFTYKDIVALPSKSMMDALPKVKQLIKMGFPLMFANLATIIIMALDRQFVTFLFSKEEYAIYAFAYNMLSLITVAVSAISPVLYPLLKRKDIEEVKHSYGTLVSLILMLVFGTLLAFFPLCWILEWFLPTYVPSIVIFRIIFPGLAISSAITIVTHNYCKVFNCTGMFFKKSIIVLIISALANCIAYYFFRTMASISIASVITMFIWYLYTETHFVKLCGYKRGKNIIYILIIMAVFYAISEINQGMIGMLVYLTLYIILSVVFFKKILIDIKNRKLFKS